MAARLIRLIPKMAAQTELAERGRFELPIIRGLEAQAIIGSEHHIGRDRALQHRADPEQIHLLSSNPV